MTARALVDLGSLAEAEAFLRWVDGIVERTGGHPERLHPLYTVDGHELGAEAVIDTLPGYAGSRPVRVGNAANHQVQLDVFGPIADLLAAVADRARLGTRQRVARPGGDGRGGRAALARARPRHLGGAPATPAPRLLQGDVLDDRRPGSAGRPPARRRGPARVGGAARPHRRERPGARLARGGRGVQRRLRRPGDGRVVALDRPVRAAAGRRPALPLHGAADRGGPAQRPGRLPLPLGRRPARPRGRLPHLHGVADRGVPAHRPARRRRGAVRADDRHAPARPGCCRSSTTRWPSAAWATTRRRTATWV